MGPDRSDRERFHLGGGNAANGASFFFTTLGQNAGYVVPVSDARLVRCTRRHQVSAVVKYSPAQQRVCIDPFFVSTVLSTSEGGLDLIEERSIQDRFVFAWIVIVLMDDLADIDAVLEQMGERAFCK
jgi:hypothetical protein